MPFSLRKGIGLHGDVSWHQVELFHTAVLSRLALALGCESYPDTPHSWSWPCQHWSLWRLRHHGGAVDYERRLEMVKLLHETRETPPAPLVMLSPQVNSWAALGLKVCQGSDESFRRTALLRDSSLISSFASRLSDSIQMLQTSNSPAWTRIFHLVRDIVLINGGGLRSATTPLVFGAVFINIDAIRQPIDLVALLVHECSHLALHIKSSSQTLVRDSKALLDSPLRVDRRPPLLVLHATYVSAYIAECMLTLSTGLTGTCRDRAIELGEEAFSDLELGLLAFADKEYLTLEGAKLIAGLADMQRELASRWFPNRTNVAGSVQ